MKVNQVLAALAIRDLTGRYAELHGFRFAHRDRLTRHEAQRLIDFGRGNPKVIAALRDKSSPSHALVRLFADVAQHFAMDHPQDQAGNPVTWPHRRSAGVATEERPYADYHPDEAEALLAWHLASLGPSDAYYDGSHPQHAEHIALMQQLHEQAEGAGAEIGEAQEGDSNEAALRAAIERTQKQPAYLDPRHPDHAATVRDVTNLYEQLHPQQSDTPAGSSTGGRALRHYQPADVAGAGEAHWRSEIARVEQLPEYRDRSHPGHEAAMSAITTAYQGLNPPPPDAP